MRIRYIKPGIVSNEDLCGLGMPAYILFTGLWMMADRAGRLEDRPRRIKALVMPLWDDVSAQDVDNLVGKLAGKGFIHRYEVNDCRYIQIVNWHRHQRPHCHEPVSVIPDCAPVTPTDSAGSQLSLPMEVSSTNMLVTRPLGEWGMGNGEREEKSGGVVACGSLAQVGPIQSPPPKKEKHAQRQRKPPASERGGRARADDGPREGPPKARAAPDYWPHTPEDVSYAHASLRELAKLIRMPPPDAAIVRKILDAGHGASVAEIHEALKAFYQRGRLSNMRSWGLIPVLIAAAFDKTRTLAVTA